MVRRRGERSPSVALVRRPHFSHKGRVGAYLKRWAGALVDLALPPRCPACASVTAAAHRFCAPCWRRLDFLPPPPDDGVRAAVAYGDIARDVVLKLKYARRLGHAEPLAAAMQRLVPDDAQLLAPVPLARGRLWSRGYNQAGLMAAALSRRTGVPLKVDALRRTRATPVLKGLNAQQRRRAVAGAFAVPRPASIAGRHVILVDDVFTTGATAEGCAMALRESGAARVTVLCFARVVPVDD
jgi:ComF family protein